MPQGSPVSPILFMLFMAPLFQMLCQRGYADDGTIVVASERFDINVNTVEEIFRKVDSWCDSNGLTLDWKKTELLHCTSSRDTANPSINRVLILTSIVVLLFYFRLRNSVLLCILTHYVPPVIRSRPCAGQLLVSRP